MLNAPIPPVPLPPTPAPARPVQVRPISPDPETAHRDHRIQEFVRRPEFPELFREAVRRFRALPPKKRKPRKPVQQIRSNAQLAKRRMQRGFSAYPMFAHLLELKQNHNGSEVPEMLPRWPIKGTRLMIIIY
jgi:hypothetical protein